ncbi:enoyl-CoA hydratase/isomerase family protein [Pararhizobium mangrovi]|uniref:Enoyl-CoA hydratase/isomerase family protein n=1 Tax=Pararhizobium mangrovi TaxID=2590452 RepID=A0A506TW03_9HYPH|nr:enoyl-CoA hydratase/isomerase family protein [Pararhizobium mangrovi]TPW26253.1 enoyl-CoA hydratase/isomerase family protein [Pararhizobium mangrovi]
MTGTLRVERFEGWARLTLDRPAKRNALDRALRMALSKELEALRGEASAVVLAANGDVFCAGLDLKEREADKAQGDRDSANDEWRALALLLREHPAIIVTAVTGLAIGAGATLVGVSDLAIASDDAALRLPEAALGSYAALSGPVTQPELSRKRAAWLLLSNEDVPAADALAWGLVNEVRPRDTVVARAGELATRIAGYDRAVVEEIKRALDSAPSAMRNLTGSLDFGQAVNRRIRSRTDAADRELARFATEGPKRSSTMDDG